MDKPLKLRWHISLLYVQGAAVGSLQDAALLQWRRATGGGCHHSFWPTSLLAIPNSSNGQVSQGGRRFAADVKHTIEMQHVSSCVWHSYGLSSVRVHASGNGQQCAMFLSCFNTKAAKHALGITPCCVACLHGAGGAWEPVLGWAWGLQKATAKRRRGLGAGSVANLCTA